MNIFKVLTAGDSATWYDGFHEYRQRAGLVDCTGFELTYQLRGPSQLPLVGVAKGDGWQTSITPEQSAALAPGEYIVVAQLTAPGVRLTLGRDKLRILADPSAMTDAVDARSMAEKALADCKAALAVFTSSGGKVKSYTIGTRTTEFYALADLMTLRDMWQREVTRERAQRAAANGRRNPRGLVARFP